MNVSPWVLNECILGPGEKKTWKKLSFYFRPQHTWVMYICITPKNEGCVGSHGRREDNFKLNALIFIKSFLWFCVAGAA